MPFYLDNPLVQASWTEHDHFLIDDRRTGDDDPTFIYFSSHAVYFPNTEEAFKRAILDRNRFEYWRQRAPQPCRHIFVRDVLKQWYIRGIGAQCNTLQGVIDWLAERVGDGPVMTVGSSAGGYAAVVCGCVLEARAVFAFSPQLNLVDTFRRKQGEDMELVAQYMQEAERAHVFDAAKIVSQHPKVPVFYFANTASENDQHDIALAQGLANIYPFLFTGHHHGVPFASALLPSLFRREIEELKALAQGRLRWTPHAFGFALQGRGYVRGLVRLMIERAWFWRYRLAAAVRRFLRRPNRAGR